MASSSLHGPAFRPTQKLSKSPVVKLACSDFTQMIQQATRTRNSAYGPFDGDTTSFSIEFFSVHDGQPLVEHHHTAPALVQKAGSDVVGPDSIYRIASITKVVTVFTFLAVAGDARFNDPITQYVPELRDAARKSDAALHPIDDTAWEDVTIGGLASHMAGIPRDLSLVGELAYRDLQHEDYGLPPLEHANVPPNGNDPGCGRAQFFEWFTRRHPIFAPSTTPIYGNAAFQLLAYALENISGKPYSALLEEKVLRPLDLSRTSTTPPLGESRCVIPGTPTSTLWDYDFSEVGPGGNLYSSPADVSKVGRAILSSSLLSKALTRRWLKPVAHTADPYYSVGAPWEIHRVTLPVTNRVVDLYAKAGGFGSFSSELILIPDFEVGLTVLAAGPPSNSVVPIISNLFSAILVPALETAAREEAKNSLVGTYSCKKPGGVESSITLMIDDTNPGQGGLSISRWVSNGQDMMHVLANLLPPLFARPVQARLHPTNNVEDVPTKKGHTKTAYRALCEFFSPAGDRGPFDRSVMWYYLDQIYWQSNALDEFILETDEEGRGVSITPRALGVVLARDPLPGSETALGLSGM
ncbi:uncharacterized protein Z520_04793 [Fonsecaea multimorphosa CBS 102226]|uniref:Uncharacterized protein n=1 Tax=Fonsecaea multimorphosa CBS 102226 TaxID=1442371 RepID=A0A0D2K076_9EURO|nr:uncharacterized protein Z520_04793 [Fonsecaea multimorphosa CBS 102226]KIX99217.1 hypothetical protein Z520_04793 [Fonsecaea multimorphosa CBS 102226]